MVVPGFSRERVYQAFSWRWVVSPLANDYPGLVARTADDICGVMMALGLSVHTLGCEALIANGFR